MSKYRKYFVIQIHDKTEKSFNKKLKRPENKKAGHFRQVQKSQ